jgi:hypothetical protein
MTKLITRIKSHVRGQATSGQNTLALTLECIEHMRDNQNEWSALAYLIGKSEPAQGRMVRLIAGRIIQGWSMKKDATQESGLRFSKIKGKNQGFDDGGIDKLCTLVGDNKSIQSADTREAFAAPKAEPTEWTEDQMKAYAKRVAKSIKEHGATGGTFVSILQNVLAEEAGDVAF